MTQQSKFNEAEFSLESPEPRQAEIALSAAEKPSTATKRITKTPVTDESQVVSYRHPDKRKNNPHVGLVNENTDPGQPKTTWRYDPHIDPALGFDPGRAHIEDLIDNALASGDEHVMRAALEELKRMQSPYLNWAGKAERTSFEVDTVSLHVHERVDAMSILAAVRKRVNDTKACKASPAIQPGLFNAPFENLPLRDAIDFYKHERGWANRLITGDSLLVMNSLLQKESMAGQVQMIYIDPPYGIKYGSNFQPFVDKRDVKDRRDEDLTQEPEMIKAFRDTWELGIHSYLTYLRDRLLLAKQLLSESGSVFVQISDENLHHVREIMDEVFEAKNFVAIISYATTSGFATNTLSRAGDYIIWFAKETQKLKYRQLHREKVAGEEGASKYKSAAQISSIQKGGFPPDKLVTTDQVTSQGASSIDTVFRFRGQQLSAPNGLHWKATASGMERLVKGNRLVIEGSRPRYVRFLDDFSVFPINNLWNDIGGVQNRTEGKVYVVQTAEVAIQRCLLMTTDPGDLVLDPTCGSGTTAFVAEKWGRRWITCDTSRVAVTLAKQRLMTASYDYYELRYPQQGLRGGFIYKTVPHVTLKSIANNPEIDEIYERVYPAIEAALADLNKVAEKSLKE